MRAHCPPRSGSGRLFKGDFHARASRFICFFIASTNFAAAQKIEIPAAVVETAFKQADCSVPMDEAVKNLEASGDLGGGLKLAEVSCWTAAYNFGSILFAVDPANPAGVKLLGFERPEKGKLKRDYQLSGSSFDDKTKLLRSYHKGRGLGDCGSAGAWRWKGTEFVLEAYWLKDKCDGKAFDPEENPGRFRIFPRKK